MVPTLLVLASAALAAPLATAPGDHAHHKALADEQLGPMASRATRAHPAALPAATPGPDVIVYGYQAYWADDLNAVPWDQLSHLALFCAEVDTSGALSETDRWSEAATAVAMAEPYGVRVHLTVVNFDTDELEALLGSSAARQNLIDELVDWQQRTGAHGINIDFEGVPSTRKEQLVAFTRDLEAAVGEVVLATPAVDWSGAWDYSELSKHADLFIMGYGYHWSGSSQAGPVDPLYGGDPWGKYALDWTVDDYLANGADPARVILGLPLYGYSWPVSESGVPASASGTGSAVLWATANSAAASYGANFDEASRTPWYEGEGRQGWYGDVDSLRERIRFAVGSGIGGIGFWALHYDDGDAALWSMVDEETRLALPADPADFTADAGAPFLAYVGDTVILSGAGSSGPDGVELEYLWTQVSGPRVQLDAETVMEPSFTVEQPGVTVFELRVGDGETMSAPARSYVVVLDEAAGERHQQAGCGCAIGGSSSGVLALGGLAALLRRRRR